MHRRIGEIVKVYYPGILPQSPSLVGALVCALHGLGWLSAQADLVTVGLGA